MIYAIAYKLYYIIIFVSYLCRFINPDNGASTVSVIFGWHRDNVVHRRWFYRVFQPPLSPVFFESVEIPIARFTRILPFGDLTNETMYYFIG